MIKYQSNDETLEKISQETLKQERLSGKLKNRGNTVKANCEVSENIKFALCISHSVEPREPREP